MLSSCGLTFGVTRHKPMSVKCGRKTIMLKRIFSMLLVLTLLCACALADLIAGLK